jgi:hypothetical protein
MASYTDYLENSILDHITGKASFTMPTVYVALFTANPTDAGGGTEAAYGSYARVTTSAATWASAASGATSNAAAITFPACTSGSSTVTGFGAYDAASGGNLLWYGTCSLSVTTGITPEFAIGELDITQT